MLSAEENERLTRVGSGTPGGELLRRYWWPIAPTEDLASRPVLPVRILGESLVLYRDRSGALGLVDERCPHRNTSLALGIPEATGLRCCYHGWLFDGRGRCLEMPLEPATSTFKERVQIKAYPVQEMGGLVWAYLGPGEPPLLPRWDLYVSPDAFRQIIGNRTDTNWLQVTENQADPGHVPVGHGRYFQYVLEREGKLLEDARTYYNANVARVATAAARGAHPVFRALPNELGYTVGRRMSDESETVASWQNGAGAMIFPTTLSTGPGDRGRLVRRFYQVVVPLDDTHTWQFQYYAFFFPQGAPVPAQTSVPYTDIPSRDADGKPILDYALGQDIAIFEGQGAIADRTKERLGESDVIVIAYRKLLAEQIDRVAAGGEPLNVFRDAERATTPDLRLPGADTGLPPRGAEMILDGSHVHAEGGRLMFDDLGDRYVRDRDVVLELYTRSASLMAARKP